MYWNLTPLLAAQVISWRSMIHNNDCVSWLSHRSTNTTFLPKPLTAFPTCFSTGERRKYVGKKVFLNPVWNSQLPGHESDLLITLSSGNGLLYIGGQKFWKMALLGRKHCEKRRKCWLTSIFCFSHNVLYRQRFQGR